MTVSELPPSNPRPRADTAASGPKAARATKAPVASVALGPTNASEAGAIQGLLQSYAPLAYMLPFQSLEHIELLATYNPDYSQAVENIKTLANSGHELFVEAGSTLQQKRIKDLLEEKARTIQGQHGGIDGLIDKLLDQAATFGAMCGEWILNEEGTDVVDFADISPKHIRFFWDYDTQRWQPYQKVSAAQANEAKKKGQQVRNGCVKLNEITFHYYSFDAAPSSPYGTPPFLAALGNIAIQRDMVANLAQIVKKVGLLGIIDIVVKSLPPIPGETPGEYQARAGQYLDAYVEVVEDMVRDGGLVHFDDIEAHTYNITGNAAGATAIFKQNEELVFSGLKSMPSVQGRSYCVVPETRVLTADLQWVPAGELRLGEELVGFDEDLGKGRGRGASTRMKSATVEVNRRITLPCVKIVTDKGEITVSKQHPLVALNRTEGRVWRQAADLRLGDSLVWFGAPWSEDRSYDAGYLAGMFDGEATIGFHGSGKNGQIAFAQNDGVVLDETLLAMKRLGFEGAIGAGRGGDSGRCAQVKLLGGQYETMRLLGQVRPHRLLAKARRVWDGATLRRGGSVNQTAKQQPHAVVTAVIDMGELEVVALQTSSRTFIAEGLLNHNSTTETYAGVAYDIIIRNTKKYQRGCKRMIEAGYWLIASLNGLRPEKINISFNENKTLHRLQDAQAEAMELHNNLVMWVCGLIDQSDFAQRHGIDAPTVPMDTPPDSPIIGNAGNVAASSGNTGGNPADSGNPTAPPSRSDNAAGQEAGDGDGPGEDEL